MLSPVSDCELCVSFPFTVCSVLALLGSGGTLLLLLEILHFCTCPDVMVVCRLAERVVMFISPTVLSAGAGVGADAGIGTNIASFAGNTVLLYVS